MDINHIEKTYHTDKIQLGYFDHMYKYVLPPYEKYAKEIMEIGTQNGFSSLLWRDLFTNADIYAIDINRCTAVENQERIIHIVGDAYSHSFCDQFTNNKFDIIIDDGPHTLESFIFLIDNYISKLKGGGMMVIEDIIDPNWTIQLSDKLSKLSDISFTIYNMAGKQKTEYLLNRWSKGLDNICIYRG